MMLREPACLALHIYLMLGLASLPAPAIFVPAHEQCQFPYLLGKIKSIFG